LKFEHPREQIKEAVGGGFVYKRVPDPTKEKGYNIVTGKLSFEINKILDPEGIAPTIVATDATRLAVADVDGIRTLTVREGLRLFGFPENYKIEQVYAKAFDLLGNSVAVPVIESVSKRLLK
jgi:DNA (cytosine-5)-methyltransferase 1